MCKKKLKYILKHILELKKNIYHTLSCKIWNYQVLEENLGENLCDLGLGKKSLRSDTKIMIHKRKNKLDFSKIKNFCCSKHTVKLMKKQLTDQNDISENHISNKGLVYRIYKTSENSVIRKWTEACQDPSKIPRWWRTKTVWGTVPDWRRETKETWWLNATHNPD